MKSRLFGCGKYRWLALERYDRELTSREQEFMHKHSAVCPPCRQEELQSDMALNLLRHGVLEPAISPNFDQRVISMWRYQRQRGGLAYWTPAFAGAALAGLALISALQLISRSAAGLPEAGNVSYPATNLSNPVESEPLPDLFLPDTRNR